MAPKPNKLDDVENLPEIARQLGQFESEEAYQQFRAEWERSKARRSSVPEVPRRRG